MEQIDSREIKIRRLNGKLRFAVWSIAVLVFFGAIAGLVYWRRTILAEQRMNENRDTAIDIIVKAVWKKDSLDIIRFDRLERKLDKMHPANYKQEAPVKFDTAGFREQVEQKGGK